MVVVKLIGGLGNQLFQYAAARRISYLHNLPLKLDISGFAQYKIHKYSLMHFKISEDVATQDEINKLKPCGIISKLACKCLKHINVDINRTYVKEQHSWFDPNMLKIRGPVYLDGYWQTEKYFKDIEMVLREELSVKTPPSPENEIMMQKIQNTNAVSLHVRRADYVTNRRVNKIHGTCSLDYYASAVNKIVERVRSPHFYVFSDDHSWAQANLKLKHPTTFVTQNGSDKNYEDLRLMSLCRHNIIANSSFSWWGAWLNLHADKIVVAPKRWSATAADNFRDLIPEVWEVV